MMTVGGFEKEARENHSKEILLSVKLGVDSAKWFMISIWSTEQSIWKQNCLDVAMEKFRNSVVSQ